MSDTKALFETLRASADPQVAAAIETLVGEGTDRALCRVNALVFAAERSLDEEKVIGAFLHAARLGLFELSWNVLCPGLRRRARHHADAQVDAQGQRTIARCAPAAMSRPSTRWSRSRSR